MARTIRGERRFTPGIRSAALRALAEVLPRSRSRLLAVAIMSNHLHIVAQQGERPLASLMQPLLRRMARMVQTAHDLEGPVFWRHYACRPCLDPLHARNAIAYTHLNPVRAGLCTDPLRYRWTSHAVYAGVESAALSPELKHLAPVLDPALALPLFATSAGRRTEHLRSDYRAFLAWRLRADATADGDNADPGQSPDELTGDGDRTSTPPPWGAVGWGASLSPFFHAPGRGRSGVGTSGVHDDGSWPIVPDMATIARNTLAREAPGMRLDSIRGRGGGREPTRIRHVIIWRLHDAGFRNVAIARFLDLSESAVSYVLCRPRPPR